MNRKQKGGIILSSLAAIAIAGSLIAGSTYALFTSESKANIAITSGKVNVSATIENWLTYTGKELTGVVKDDAEKIKPSTEYDLKNGEFMNGGTASLKDNVLTLDKITPGDKVTFSIKIENKSDVAIKYRTIISCVSDDGLFEGLEVNIGGEEYQGLTKKSDWEALGAEKDLEEDKATVNVSVSLPSSAGNEFQGKKCEISYQVEAIQGNAETTNPAANVIEISNATELSLFRASINRNKDLYNGKTVTLTKNIDLNGATWTPIVYDHNADYRLTFDGNNKTISNFVIDESEGSAAKNIGLFGEAYHLTIENLTISGAKIRGVNHVGAIIGHGYGNTITGCKVIDSTITGSIWWDPNETNPIDSTKGYWNDGDKVGAIAGYLGEGGNAIAGCEVERCTIKGYRDVGGIIGYIDDQHPNKGLSGNSVKNITLINDRSHNYKNYKDTDNSLFDVEPIIGEYFSNTTVSEDNTSDNITQTIEYADGFSRDYSGTADEGVVCRITNANGLKWFSDATNALKTGDYANLGKFTVKLMDDIDLNGESWTPMQWLDGTTKMIFDGNDKTVSNFTVD